MHGEVVNLFAAWEGFYVIIGSSAAALTGLQFVVMALVAETERPGGPKEIAAFGSPTVVHFCSALVIAALFTAPWPAPTSAGWAASLVGLGGVVYAAIVLGRARSQTGYKPVFEDWLWHIVLPVVAYVTLFVSGLMFVDVVGAPAFFIGGSALSLVLVGIHNAWDTVTYVTFEQRARKEAAGVEPANPPPIEAQASSDVSGGPS
jgi:hypothetical protein